jgi:hypothetical protein
VQIYFGSPASGPVTGQETGSRNQADYTTERQGIAWLHFKKKASEIAHQEKNAC